MSEGSVFAPRLRQAMADAHLTQAELSRRSGIDKASISLYLNGRYQPKAEKLRALADALDVSSQWLAGLAEAPAADAPLPLPVVCGAFWEDGAPRLRTEDAPLPVPPEALGGRDAASVFLLRVAGLAMYPRMLEGDLLLMERLETPDALAECEDAAALLLGDRLLLRRIRSGPEGRTLLPWNPEFPPRRLDTETPWAVLGRGLWLLRRLG